MNTTPVFLANRNSKAKVVINQGGTSCFGGSQLIITKRGSIAIKDVVIGDFVLSFNEETKKQQWKEVKNLFSYQNSKKTVRLKLKNGTEIIVTEDHHFYYEGGWHSIKHILSLRDGNMEANCTI